MVISNEVEEAVNKQTLHFLMKSAFIFCCLSKCCLGAYHYITKQNHWLARYFLEAVVHREREYVCGPGYAAIKGIQLLHPPVVNQQYPEFSSSEIE